ncbi:MAG: hypothetical protein FWC23_02710 [Chitinispirillia bacterium]|nr:hypothetical protein [Chitinispirillia bacterium]MCL2268088.1 hypothetical protein [Chitinispirillia bacterium]
MANPKRFAGIGAAFLFTFALVAAFWGPATAQTGDKYCEIALAGCPQDYDGSQLVVPLDVIAMSSVIRGCVRVDSSTGGNVETPAIMFIIDHSRSMRLNNNSVSASDNDPNGNRFRVTRALVDTIAKVVPDAQVGVAIFASGLVHQTSWDRNLIAFEPSPSDGAYLPLRPLNATAQTGGYASGSNATWYDVIMGMFNVPANVNNRSTLRNGSGNTVNEQSNTNISIAFEAAIMEFQKNNAANGIPPKNQYIIFLSDGEPTVPSGSAWNSKLNNFRDSTANTPTTYTVFLTNNNSPIPAQLNTMTANIQNNGYSNNNPNSNIWSIAADYDGLLSLMMDNIIAHMMTNVDGTPRRIIIQSAGVRDSTGEVDNNFTFSRRLPIDTADITNVSMGVTYNMRIDSTWVIPGTDRDTTTTVRTVDSLFTYEFTVRRTADAASLVNWQNQSGGLEPSCGEKPTLGLQFRGETLASSATNTVKEVRGNMDVLTVVFDNTAGLFDYTNVIVQVLNDDGTISDTVNLTLRKAGNIWTSEFPRLTVSNPDMVNTADGVLQHAPKDSIILVFRNPEIPLDTLRIAVPYIHTNMAFYDIPGPPDSTRLYPDAISVIAGDQTDIYAKFFDADGVWDQTIDPSKVVWTLNDRTNASLKIDGLHAMFESTVAGRLYSVTATYTEGTMVITRSINISVVPGPPVYLEVVLDPSRAGAQADTNKLKEPQEYTFEKDVSSAVFYVIERDRYGNRITEPDFSRDHYVWSSNDPRAITANRRDSTSADVKRQGNSFANGLQVTVTKGLLEGKVNIKVVGEASVAMGPNPFIPGTSSVKDRLERIGLSEEAKNTYMEIVNREGLSNHGGGSNDPKGILIAATAPRNVLTSGTGSTGNPKVTIMIYDAVGNVVFRSKPNDITLANDGTTFGFVWDGKNMSGRNVGPGTYLVHIVAQTDGERFNSRRKIGVTLEGKLR